MFGILVRLLLWLLSYVRLLVTSIIGDSAGKAVDWVCWKVSGKHKIQRISSNYKGLNKMKLLESCLQHSKHQELNSYKDYSDVQELTSSIIKVKDIKPALDPEFIARCNTTFHPLCQINLVTTQALLLKQTKYDTDNEEHEMLLLSMWNCLQPDRQLDKRVSEMWADVGFQGKDPATDFRGMGILGLHNLHYLAKHKKSAQKLLSASNHPQYGFSLAITSINLTAEVYTALIEGPLRHHFYYKCTHGGARNLTIADLHEVFCAVLCDFVQYYQEQHPASIMEFNVHKAAYVQNVLKPKLMSENPFMENVE